MMSCFEIPDSEKFGWFGGAVVTVVSSFISDRVELSNIPNPAVCHTVCRCWMKPWISGLFFQVLNQRIRHVSVECQLLADIVSGARWKIIRFETWCVLGPTSAIL